MSKPWEQEWRKGGGRTGEHALSIYDEEGYCVVAAPSAEEVEFIAAAPDMARALMGSLVENPHPRSKVVERHTPACWDTIYAYLLVDACGNAECAAARAALRKAGVLP